ncbi:MAG TPA: hypothetical protein PLZ05_03030 [Alphaproteobacteria bacterium]|nr:hypothetical protein [Alphaproteobacteria bacterium]
MYKIKKEVLIACEEVFGLEMQKLLVIEEMSELTKEIIKNVRGKDNRDAIVEEMADVLNMFDQMLSIYEISDDELDNARISKVLRLTERIEKKRSEKNA